MNFEFLRFLLPIFTIVMVGMFQRLVEYTENVMHATDCHVVN